MPKGAGARARRDKARPPVYVRRRIARRVAERDGHRCWICGRLVLDGVSADHPLSATMDHVIPHADGGRWVASNLKLAHRACNQERGAVAA